MYKFFGKIIFKLIGRYIPNIQYLNDINQIQKLISHSTNSKISGKAKLYENYKITETEIGNYTYIAENSKIQKTKIGNFCSIGPNFMCGWGIHPINGISTAPMFYSTLKQNGTTLSKTDKFIEQKPIYIGNDVFIGMNVTILDGVTIGDGAVIGAGAIVSKDIPPYAVAVGSPIKIIHYRFGHEIIEKLIKLKWWDWEEDKLPQVEAYFNNVEEFIKINS
jgi:acetyltransferase-like isoleucine patch superfamily enzyme